MRTCAILAALATAPGVLVAQALPRYLPEQLACVAYAVQVHTTVTTDLQGRTRTEEVDRAGRLVVRGTAADSGTQLEAWWDSLVLSRRADQDTLTPDPAGIIGGRYRGLLHPDGRFERSAAPWVPDEVAEVSDLSLALDDLFPVFVPGTVRRTGGGRDQQRYRIRSESSTNAPPDGARTFTVLESNASDGMVTWGREGLIDWTRTVTAETRVKETPRRTFRSQVTQRIALRRLSTCTP